MELTKRRVRVATDPHHGHPFRTVMVNGTRIGRVKKADVMGFLIWKWEPLDEVPDDGAAITGAVPQNKQFGSLAEVRRYFGDLLNEKRTGIGRRP